jgi:hypothetical protein
MTMRMVLNDQLTDITRGIRRSGGDIERAEGPAVLPAQGNALGVKGRFRLSSGPTGQSFGGRWRVPRIWYDRVERLAPWAE